MIDDDVKDGACPMCDAGIPAEPGPLAAILTRPDGTQQRVWLSQNLSRKIRELVELQQDPKFKGAVVEVKDNELQIHLDPEVDHEQWYREHMAKIEEDARGSPTGRILIAGAGFRTGGRMHGLTTALANLAAIMIADRREVGSDRIIKIDSIPDIDFPKLEMRLRPKREAPWGKRVRNKPGGIPFRRRGK